MEAVYYEQYERTAFSLGGGLSEGGREAGQNEHYERPTFSYGVVTCMSVSNFPLIFLAFFLSEDRVGWQPGLHFFFLAGSGTFGCQIGCQSTVSFFSKYVITS
jgi:hypothetical protein